MRGAVAWDGSQKNLASVFMSGSRRRLWRREGGSTWGTRPLERRRYLGGLVCGNLVGG